MHVVEHNYPRADRILANRSSRSFQKVFLVTHPASSFALSMNLDLAIATGPAHLNFMTREVDLRQSRLDSIRGLRVSIDDITDMGPAAPAHMFNTISSMY